MRPSIVGIAGRSMPGNAFPARRVQGQIRTHRPKCTRTARTVDHVAAVEIAALGVQPKRNDAPGAVRIQRHETGDALGAARRRKRAVDVKEQIAAGRDRIEEQRLVAKQFVEIRQVLRGNVGVDGDIRDEFLSADVERPANGHVGTGVPRQQRNDADFAVTIDDARIDIVQRHRPVARGDRMPVRHDHRVVERPLHQHAERHHAADLLLLRERKGVAQLGEFAGTVDT